MNKEKYEYVELEIFKFQTNDVITESKEYVPEDDETELIKN